ncbi:uncharacterized protein [Aristolochia californica]|uniref:uncharacterized protein n=1 Tax=Aristolochia californica TaxID=171875 RepID=UPI0035D82648
MDGSEWNSTLLEKLTSLLSDFTDSNIQPTDFSPDPSFQFLNPYQASQEFEQLQWKQLYSLLLQISIYSSLFQHNFGDDLKDFAREELKLQDIATLSGHLFEEVHQQFKFISAVAASEQKQSDILIPLNDFISLLRCCLVILPLLEFDPCIVPKRCQTLVAILEKSCHPGPMLCDSSTTSAPITTNPAGLDTPIYGADQAANNVLVFCSVLEVFIDELLKDKRLKKYFIRPKYFSPTKDKAFHSVHDRIILEVVCSHFLLSVSNECSLNNFTDTLFWSHLNLRTPKLTLATGLTLLGSSIILSAPLMLLAHLVSLVSSCVGINLTPFETRTSPILLAQYISAFELSINLYKREMFRLQKIYQVNEEVSDLGLYDMEQVLGGKGYRLNFEFCILPMTYDKINFQVHELVKSSQPSSGSVISQALGRDLLSTSTAFIQENLHILDELHRDEISSILKLIIEMILSRENWVNAASAYGEVSQPEMYLLAAVMKLMSCSLLQIVGYMRQSWSTVLFRSDYSSCREYDFMIRIIGCFGQYSKTVPIQKALLDVLGMDAIMHKETKMMLIHLAGWLLLAFQSGHDFLWKSYIFMMMALMNLVIFEEGNIDALKPIIVCAKESSCSPPSFAKVPQDGKHCRSSQNIALNFQKIQMIHMKESSKHLKYEIQGLDTECPSLVEASNNMSISSYTAPHVEKAKLLDFNTEDEGTCNGQVFIKCLRKSSDYDDLVDFIACTPGKDYSTWLKNKKRFKQWKESKRQASLLAKKKNCWNSMNGRSCRFFPYSSNQRKR